MNVIVSLTLQNYIKKPFVDYFLNFVDTFSLFILMFDCQGVGVGILNNRVIEACLIFKSKVMKCIFEGIKKARLVSNETGFSKKISYFEREATFKSCPFSLILTV